MVFRAGIAISNIIEFLLAFWSHCFCARCCIEWTIWVVSPAKRLNHPETLSINKMKLKMCVKLPSKICPRRFHFVHIPIQWNRWCVKQNKTGREAKSNPRLKPTESDCYLFGLMQHIVLITYVSIGKRWWINNWTWLHMWLVRAVRGALALFWYFCYWRLNGVCWVTISLSIFRMWLSSNYVRFHISDFQVTVSECVEIGISDNHIGSHNCEPLSFHQLVVVIPKQIESCKQSHFVFC